MSLTLCSLMFAITVASGPSDVPAATTTPRLAALSSSAADVPVEPQPNVREWKFDVTPRRPAALPILYGSLGALQALDVYSTRRALHASGREVNPVVANAAGNSGAMLAVKAISTATSIYFTERAWKKNRKGAVVLMAVINGVTAAVTARNFRNAR